METDRHERPAGRGPGTRPAIVPTIPGSPGHLVSVRRTRGIVAAALVAIVAGAGCATKTVRPAKPGEWAEGSRVGCADGRDLGLAARRWLYRTEMEDPWRRDPEELISDSMPRLAASGDPVARVIASELCLAAGRRADTPKDRRRWALAAAREAYALITGRGETPRANPLTPDLRNAAEVYNAALSDYLVALDGELPKAETLATPGATITVDPAAVLDTGVEALWSARQDVVRREQHVNRRYGIGAAVVAYLPSDDIVPDNPPYHPPVRVATIRAGSLLARFDPGPGDPGETVSLSLHDPTESPTARLGPAIVPLETDLSLPLARVLDENAEFRGLAGMPRYLRGDFVTGLRGLYLLTPYRAGRIPVVLVHGLMDSPLTWIPLINEIQADSVLASRVQVWAFFYATVSPIPQSASELRHSLRALRGCVDADDTDAAWDRMVVVGHSMGGLIARMLVSDGDIEIPPDLAEAIAALAPDRRDYVQSLARLRPLPEIDRAILLGAPHRGARMASTLPGRIGNALISLPKAAVDYVRAGAAEDMPSVATPTGIRNLRPDSVFVRGLADIPLPSNVPFHTIAADRREAGRTGGSDGVVPYESAHLDGAVSELVVKSDHLHMHKEPAAIAEILRILRIHLRDAPDVPPAGE